MAEAQYAQTYWDQGTRLLFLRIFGNINYVAKDCHPLHHLSATDLTNFCLIGSFNGYGLELLDGSEKSEVPRAKRAVVDPLADAKALLVKNIQSVYTSKQLLSVWNASSKYAGFGRVIRETINLVLQQRVPYTSKWDRRGRGNFHPKFLLDPRTGRDDVWEYIAKFNTVPKHFFDTFLSCFDGLFLVCNERVPPERGTLYDRIGFDYDPEYERVMMRIRQKENVPHRKKIVLTELVSTIIGRGERGKGVLKELLSERLGSSDVGDFFTRALRSGQRSEMISFLMDFLPQQLTAYAFVYHVHLLCGLGNVQNVKKILTQYPQHQCRRFIPRSIISTLSRSYGVGHIQREKPAHADARVTRSIWVRPTTFTFAEVGWFLKCSDMLGFSQQREEAMMRRLAHYVKGLARLLISNNSKDDARMCHWKQQERLKEYTADNGFVEDGIDPTMDLALCMNEWDRVRGRLYWLLK